MYQDILARWFNFQYQWLFFLSEIYQVVVSFPGQINWLIRRYFVSVFVQPCVCERHLN